MQNGVKTEVGTLFDWWAIMGFLNCKEEPGHLRDVLKRIYVALMSTENEEELPQTMF